MPALTPSERRGAMVVVLLLAIGAARDLWRALHPRPTAPTAIEWNSGNGDVTGAASHPITPVPPLSDPAVRARRPGEELLPPGAVLDLNRATIAELDALPGIGPVLARRIVEHRERHGPFRSPEELLAVRGIGPRSLARLAPYLRAGSSAPAR